jgi:hypothetical protein
VYVVGISGRLWDLMDKMGCFKFWSFCVDVDIMRVYVVGADGHVLSCLSGLCEKLRVYSEEIIVLRAFSVVFLRVCTYSFSHSVVGSLVVFLFAVVCQ